MPSTDILDLAAAPGARRIGPARLPAALVAALIAIGFFAIALPVWLLIASRNATRHTASMRPIPTRVIPRDEVPPVEPVAIADLSADDARAYNADIPFASGANPAAPPFRFGRDGEALARATDCLAAALIYEAGDDPPGERAVGQVVLNRVRHPAFPKTVCGVVFQGSERSTGCQFTFTCDGSIARRSPNPAAWERARKLAGEMLVGAVYKPVGLATHYHADYVVPYWQASLDKLAEVHTQIFYRWSGWWGSSAVFHARGVADEPVIAALAKLSDAHRAAVAAPPPEQIAAATLAGSADSPSGERPAASLNEDDATYLVTLPAGVAPLQYPALAILACGGRSRCKYMAWGSAKETPAAAPIGPAQIATMRFSYLRDRATGFERTLWNCRQTPRPEPSQCMKAQLLLTASPVAPAATTAAPASDLAGVRRRPATEPSPAPAPKPPGTSPAAAP